ncbi:hypothetical protein TNIN_312361, partial [Trichonephila inaurata madagascariensis]
LVPMMAFLVIIMAILVLTKSSSVMAMDFLVPVKVLEVVCRTPVGKNH